MSLSRNIVRFVVNYVIRGLLACVTVFGCWISIVNYDYWFTWHVILCTLGYLPLMAEALMLFAQDELYTNQLTRTQKYWIHGVLLLLSTTIITAGVVDLAIFSGSNYEHFTTGHGLTGLISNILLLLSIILGLMVNYSNKLKNYCRPILLKFLHNSLGLFGYIIGLTSLCLAFYTNWFVYYTTEEARIAALIATILGGLWTMNSAFLSLSDQIKTIFLH